MSRLVGSCSGSVGLLSICKLAEIIHIEPGMGLVKAESSGLFDKAATGGYIAWRTCALKSEQTEEKEAFGV